MQNPSPSRTKIATRVAAAVGLGLLLLVQSGCGALLLIGGAGTSAIAFATGELTASEEAPLASLDRATEMAIGTLGYEASEVAREANRVQWKATTLGGDPVEIQLIGDGPERTTVKIRIGVFGDEPRSRLVLEQIRQSQ